MMFSRVGKESKDERIQEELTGIQWDCYEEKLGQPNEEKGAEQKASKK